jgi:putative ABC transport system substrate-binding protein
MALPPRRRDHRIGGRPRDAAVYNYREFVTSGGLMSADLAESYRQLGIYTGKILESAKPADLPVRPVVKLELFINAKTAKAIGLTNSAAIARPRR